MSSLAKLVESLDIAEQNDGKIIRENIQYCIGVREERDAWYNSLPSDVKEVSKDVAFVRYAKWDDIHQLCCPTIEKGVCGMETSNVHLLYVPSNYQFEIPRGSKEDFRKNVIQVANIVDWRSVSGSASYSCIKSSRDGRGGLVYPDQDNAEKYGSVAAARAIECLRADFGLTTGQIDRLDFSHDKHYMYTEIFYDAERNVHVDEYGEQCLKRTCMFHCYCVQIDDLDLFNSIITQRYDPNGFMYDETYLHRIYGTFGYPLYHEDCENAAKGGLPRILFESVKRYGNYFMGLKYLAMLFYLDLITDKEAGYLFKRGIECIYSDPNVVKSKTHTQKFNSAFCSLDEFMTAVMKIK